MDDLEQISRIRAVELAVTGIIMALENVPDSNIANILTVVRAHRAKTDPDTEETEQTLHFFDALANL